MGERLAESPYRHQNKEMWRVKPEAAILPIVA
jgi:hypothetical protein